MAEIAVIGKRDSIYGFSALGFSVFPVPEEKENAKESIKETLRELSKGDYGIIFITEEAAAEVPEEIDKYRFLPTPAVILIPGLSGNTGAGEADLEKTVKKAIGSNII